MISTRAWGWLLVAGLAGCKGKDGPAPGAGAVASGVQGAQGASGAPVGKRGHEAHQGGAGHEAKGGATGCQGVKPGSTKFGFYLLALSWSPSFCCGHPGKQECANLAGFASDHLTLHGLWPSYTDAEAAAAKHDWPEFCGDCGACGRQGAGASCGPPLDALPAEMATLAPGYVNDDHFLANHEWPKHGSCSGLDPTRYFTASLDALKRLPGDRGTPELLTKSVGGSVAAEALRASFGSPESVVLSCDASCNLQQVGVCLAHDAGGLPTTPVACPSIVTRSSYDNGCFTRGCKQINVTRAGACAASPGHPPAPASAAGASACNHPGQGPACTSDDACKQQGFSRCARSGCCTSVPLGR